MTIYKFVSVMLILSPNSKVVAIVGIVLGSILLT